MTIDGVSRRHALTGAATIGLGVPLLAACGSDESVASDSGASTGGEADAPTAGVLTTTSEVAVGGGAIFSDAKVVVTQPTEGDFKAFTSICTHSQCPVTEIVGEQIRCRCHGSAFSIVDGSVVGGPAPAPLSEVPIAVDGDEISLT